MQYYLNFRSNINFKLEKLCLAFDFDSDTNVIKFFKHAIFFAYQKE